MARPCLNEIFMLKSFKELMKREEVLRIQMETMDAEEEEALMPILMAEKAELELQWQLAMAVIDTEDDQ